MHPKNQLNIIMFNMSRYADWQNGAVNRNFHVLHNLIKDKRINKVIAVDFLAFNWQRAIKNYINDQIIKDTRGEIVYGDLTSRCWQIGSKILVYSTIDNLMNPGRIISELKKIVAKEKMQENLIVWNYNPLYIDYLGNLNQKLNIFDAVDNWLKHSSYQKYQDKLASNYRLILEKSDLIFTVSENLKKDLFENQNKANWIPNAVDLEHFQTQTEIYDKLKNIPQPIIGFLGILQDRIDVEILLYLAKKNPEKSLILAGPVWPDFPKNKFNEFANVHFLGQIKYEDIPKLYNGFDVGIIPYKINEFTQSIDPMKFYEYLAAGLPIVTTPVSGFKTFADYINVAKNPEQFNDFVNQAIMKGKLNSSSEILENHTWRKRVGEMLDIILSRI